MKLKKLSLKNIRSYRNEEVKFPEGSMLLAGDVGSGKTSLLLAVEYALFGLQSGQKGSSLLRNDTSQGEVALELEIAENEVLIERKLKRSSKNVTNEYSSITINGEKKAASLTEVKTKVLEILGYPQEFIKKNNLLYRYTVYTPQEQMKQIILEDNEVRLNVLRHILGIDKYKRIRENLTLVLNNIKEKSKVLQGEIKNLDNEKEKLELKKKFTNELELAIIEKIKNVESKINERRMEELEYSKLENKIKEKEYLEKEVEKTKIMIVNKYENLATIDNELSDLDRSVSEVGELFDEKEYQDIINKLERENEKLENLDIHYTSILTEINSLEKNQQENILKKERIFKIDICPTCLQDVSQTYKHNIINEKENLINDAQKRISYFKNELAEITLYIKKEKQNKKILEENKSLKELLRTKSEYLIKLKKRAEQMKKQRENLEKDVELLNKHMGTLKKKILELYKFDNLAKIKIEELKKALLEEKNTEISLAEVKKELELTRKEIVIFEESIIAKESSKKNLSYLLELSDWLSLTFLSLIDFTERNVLIKLRQEFSGVFGKWFRMLVPQESLAVRIDESFSPVILNNDFEMEYSFLSGGERTAIALAYRLALNQTINSILSEIKTKEIVILDEPTDGFSEMQLERMRDVLQELNVAQLIIVSHEQKIESFVDNVIRIKKFNNSSYIERDMIEGISSSKA